MSLPRVPSLNLLGGAVIQVDGRPLGGPASHRHRLALLALLATAPLPMSRDKLIALLWPERDGESARNLLKVAVHELRKALGEDLIRSTGDQLHLDLSLVQCDVVHFDTAVAAKEHERAALMYAGPFLDGFFLKDARAFERWAEEERTRLAQSYARCLDHLADTAERSGEMRSAARWLQALALHDPMRTDVALRFMRALAASGDRAAAIRHAELHATRRREDLAVEPDPAIASLARDLASRPARGPAKS